nr:hypothetical protein [Tanacetum cinerariifolium]
MARLQFCDYHNMVAILEKGEHNVDFHPIVDFVEASPLSLQRQLSELTAKFQAREVKINRLKERVKMLEDREGVDATRSRDDVPIKGRSMDEGEAGTEKISDDSEEMVTVLTSMDAATILASGVVDVPTGSGSIPTASTPAEEQVPTGVMWFPLLV